MSSSTSTSAVTKYYGYTEVETQQFSYEWRIKNFRLLPEENGEFIYSPIFRANEKDEVKWKLQLFPKGENEDVIDYVSVFLFLHSRDAAKKNINVDCELSIAKSGSEERTCHSFIFTYENKVGRGFSRMIKRSKLLDNSSSDDSITIRCKVNVAQRTISKSLNPITLDLQKGQLSEHFSQLLENSHLCDVTLVVGNERFPAHKLVLTARSAVFAAMFEHKDMEENRKNEVKIEDLDPATVRGMLEFIYTDKVTDLETLARGLLRASDKYQLDRLRMMCEGVLYETVTNDNAADILILSDLYNSQKLKDYVMEYIDGHLLSVMQSESYKSMVGAYPSLVNELTYSIAVRRESKK